MKRKCLISAAIFLFSWSAVASQKPSARYADAHFHISNYAYQGVSLKTLIHHYMGGKIARTTIMPLPLQQKWDGFEHYTNDKIKPNYYMGPKAELYYYAFADAMIAKEYAQLSASDKSRLDPMITGFNPMDEYASLHIKRVLLTFPGVFSGIGEFTVHKEIVSKKIAGDSIQSMASGKIPKDVSKNGKLSLYSPALVGILNLAAETGLVATLHNDIYETDVKYDGTHVKKFPKSTYVAGLIHLCQESPQAKVIWAHTGLGRFVKPTKEHFDLVSQVLEACPNWSVDISWDLVQKNIATPEKEMPSLEGWRQFITRYQNRVLWGSDTVIYSRNKLDEKGEGLQGKQMSVKDYLDVADILNPLWEKLGDTIATRVRLKNYTMLFDQAKTRVRRWESQHKNDDVWDLK